MNKVLLKAAVVLNIAAASLVYVSCSGDDGAKGDPGPAGPAGAGCEARPSATVDGFDIYCGDVLQGSIKNGTAVNKGEDGAPGASCTGVEVATGIEIFCGGVSAGIVKHGTSGGGGPVGTDGCEATSITVTATGDPAINIRCPDNRSATIVVCPGGSKATTGSTGLLIDEQGLVAKCLADGTISRSGDIAVLSCGNGGAQFDPRKEFCQNTFMAGDTAGLFAVVEGTGTAERLRVGGYPEKSYASINSATHQYNKAAGRENVKSIILPLCGAEPAPANASDNAIGNLHVYGNNGVDHYAPVAAAGNTVYNGKQFCGRNLVIKSTSYKSGTNTPLAGGILDINTKSPVGAAWSVLDAKSCTINLETAGEGAPENINGFSFVTSLTITSPDWLTRPCDFMDAIIVEEENTPPYSTCPSDKPVVGIDDVVCTSRDDCVYHSTIDNTCLKKEGELVSLYGVQTAGAIRKVVATPKAILNSSSSVTGYYFEAARSSASGNKGITATTVGSRFGAAGLLKANGNLWSKACKTLSRTSYYAVNDPYLTNKPFKDDPNNQPEIIYASSSSIDNVPGPICEDLTPVGTPPAPTQAAVSFETAFACLNGSLSVDKQGGNTGNTWDRPLYCVLDGYSSDRYCAVSGTGITEDVCKGNAVALTGNDPNDEGLTKVTKNGSAVTPLDVSFSWANGVCTVGGDAVANAAGGLPTQGNCQALDGISLSVNVPKAVPGTIRGWWVEVSSGPVEGCLVYNESSSAAAPAAINATTCALIQNLTYGLNNPVLGKITSTWEATLSDIKSLNVHGVSAGSGGSGGCIVSSNQSQALSSQVCSQITAAAQNFFVATPIDNANFYWVQ